MRRLPVLLLSLCLHQVAHGAGTSPSKLEQLFNAGSFPQFLKAARPLADRDDPEALFLLGKAYHLGKGVEADPYQAMNLYGRAAELGNARAENNLGQLLLDGRGSARSALAHFERAIALGLTEPGVHNARRARAQVCRDEGDLQVCMDVGKVFEAAWKKEQDNKLLDEAIVIYTAACERQRYDAHFDAGSKARPDPIPACVRAIELAETGARLGLPRATHNRGAIDYNAKNFTGALTWFERGYQLGFARSAYGIATMYENGQGVPEDAAQALTWYERAAELKDAKARDWVEAYWLNETQRSFDPALLQQALAKLRKLEANQQVLQGVQDNLDVIDTMKRNATAFPLLAQRPLRDSFCPRDPDFYGLQEWRMFAVTDASELGEMASELTVAAEGVADEEGCIRFDDKAVKTVRQALAQGNTLVLNWPGRRIMLSASPDSRGKIAFALARPVPY